MLKYVACVLEGAVSKKKRRTLTREITDKLGNSMSFIIVINAFQRGQRHHERLGDLKKKTGAGERGEATAGEPVMAMSWWGMRYADDAGVVSQTPE